MNSAPFAASVLAAASFWLKYMLSVIMFFVIRNKEYNNNGKHSAKKFQIDNMK